MADRKLNVDVVLNSNKAKSELAALEKQGNSTAKKISSGFGSVQQTFKAALGIGAVVTGLNTLKNTFSSAIALANDQTAAITTLNAALQANGNYTLQNSQAVQTYASELQQLIGVGDEVLIGVVAQVEALTGLGTDVMPDVMKAAVQLSNVLGKDLNVAAEMLAKQLNGDTDVLKRYIGETKEAGDVNKTLGNILEKTSAGMEIAIQKTKTFEGSMALLNANWGDLLEELGFFITENPVIRQAIKDLTQLVLGWTGSINENREAQEANAKAQLNTYADIVDGIGQVIVFANNAITGIEVVAKAVGSTIALVAGGLLQGIGYAVGGVIDLMNLIPGVNIGKGGIDSTINFGKGLVDEAMESFRGLDDILIEAGRRNEATLETTGKISENARNTAKDFESLSGTGVDLFKKITDDKAGTGKAKKDVKEMDDYFKSWSRGKHFDWLKENVIDVFAGFDPYAKMTQELAEDLALTLNIKPEELLKLWDFLPEALQKKQDELTKIEIEAAEKRHSMLETAFEKLTGFIDDMGSSIGELNSSFRDLKINRAEALGFDVGATAMRAQNIWDDIVQTYNELGGSQSQLQRNQTLNELSKLLSDGYSLISSLNGKEGYEGLAGQFLKTLEDFYATSNIEALIPESIKTSGDILYDAGIQLQTAADMLLSYAGVVNPTGSNPYTLNDARSYIEMRSKQLGGNPFDFNSPTPAGYSYGCNDQGCGLINSKTGELVSGDFSGYFGSKAPITSKEKKQKVTKPEAGFDLFGQGIVPLLSAGFANINGEGGFAGGVRNSLGGVLGGIANSILPAPFGGLVGSLVGGLFKKKSKPTTKAEALPVKVINFSEIQSSLLNTTKQSLLAGTIGNISRLDRMRVAQAATGI